MRRHLIYCVRRHLACVTTDSTFTLRHPIVVEIFLVTASLTLENRLLGGKICVVMVVVGRGR